MRSVAKWIVNVCLNGWVLLRGFLRGVLLFMFYKKFAAVVLSAVLVGVVPSVVFADADGISAVSDGDVEELSIEDDFSDGADSISAFASALADKTVSEVQGYQEAKAEAEVIAQERLEAEAAAEAARKAEEERKAAEAARLEKRRGIVDFEPLEKEYVVKKGEVSLVIPVTMIRTKALQTEEKGIDMELLPNGHFTTYYDYGSSDSTSWVKTQRLKLILLFSEFMNEPPSQWNPYMFGEFSAKKFALICDEMDIPREEFNKKSEEAGYILSRMGYIGSYMKKYLADEKAAGRTVYEEDGITEMTMGPQAQ